MVTLVEPTPHRTPFAHAVWALDCTVWLVMLLGGGVILASGSPAVLAVLGHSVLLITFAAFWLLGSAAGFVLRLFQLGIAEVPAIVAALTALASYELILWGSSAHGLQPGMAQVLAGIAFLNLVRRWVVLAALGNEGPASRGVTRRIIAWARNRP